MIWLQLLTALLNVLNARLQKPFLRKRIDNGSTKWQTFVFHVISWISRAAVVAGLSFLHPSAVPYWLCFVALGLVSYLVFDIAIGYFVWKDPWFLGTTANADVFVKNGRVKAIVLGIIIIVVNIYLWQNR